MIGNKQDCKIYIFFDQMCFIFLNLIWLISYAEFIQILFYLHRNFNKLSIKYQSYPKSTKINTFEQKYEYDTTL